MTSPSGIQQLDWDSLGVTHEHHKLFILQWRELFAEETLDTWQVRTSNVLTILEEVERTIQVAASEYAPAQGALPELIKEALVCIERDLVIKQQFAFVRGALDALMTQTNGLGDDPGPTRLEAVGRRARVIRESIDRTYRQGVVDALRDLLNGDGKKREDQINLTMSLGTVLSAAGFSRRHLRAVWDLLRDPRKPFIERFDALCSQCDALSTSKFRVHFIVRNWPGGVRSERVGAWIAKSADARSKIPKSQNSEEFLKRAAGGGNDRIAAIDTLALDLFAATERAEETLTADFAAVAFASFQEPHLAGPEALVLTTADVSFTVPLDHERSKALRPSNDWKARTQALLQADKLLAPEDANHLNATLAYFRLAITHPADDVRLVNLWVAAETLVRRAGGGSIIQRITSTIAPLMAVRNIRRVAKGLARRLQWTLRYKQLEELDLLAPGTGSRRIEHLELLKLLVDTPRAQALLKLLNHDPLLRLRLSRFADRALKDAKAAGEYIAVNHQNIVWQLGRIYRARNAIVHRGERPSSTRQLLQHLETYVWTAIR